MSLLDNIAVPMKIDIHETVHPESPENLELWAGKWRLTPQQIKNAILETGRIDAKSLRDHLRKDNILYHPWKGARVILNKTIHTIF